MHYTHLLFDLDNTLLDFTRSEAYALEETFSDFSLPYEQQYIDLYHGINRACWDAFEDGKMDLPTLRATRFAKFIEAMPLERDAERVGEAYLQHLGNTDFWVDGAKPLLDRLRPHFNIVLVTNGLKEVQWARLNRTGLVSYFEAIVISEEIGVSKPANAYFEHTFDQLKHPEKSQVLMIGDNLNSDIRGGNDFGLATCWYNPRQLNNETDVRPSYEIQTLQTLENLVGI